MLECSHTLTSIDLEPTLLILYILLFRDSSSNDIEESNDLLLVLPSSLFETREFDSDIFSNLDFLSALQCLYSLSLVTNVFAGAIYHHLLVFS